MTNELRKDEKGSASPSWRLYNFIVTYVHVTSVSMLQMLIIQRQNEKKLNLLEAFIIVECNLKEQYIRLH